LTRRPAKDRLKPVRYMSKILFILIAAAMLMPGNSARAAAAQAERPDIILITVDSMRPDRLGCYGYKGGVSPSIDRFSDGAVIFDDAVTCVPLTTPSYACIFSGLYPKNTRVFKEGGKVGARCALLAETLRANGYATAAFTSVSMVHSATHIDRGFEVYDDVDTYGSARRKRRKRTAGYDPSSGWSPNAGDPENINSKIAIESRKFVKSANEEGRSRNARVTVDAALEWLDNAGKSPFFLWVQLHDPCMPYNPPPEFVRKTEFEKKLYGMANTEARNNLKLFPLKKSGPAPAMREDYKTILSELYDGEIRYGDAEIARLFKALEQKNPAGVRVIIVAAPYGEMLGEKFNFFGHSRYLFEPCVRIPLILKMPGIKPGRVKPLARSIDIAPTLLDYLGIDSGDKCDGMSLLPVLKGKRAGGPEWAALETNFQYKRRKDYARMLGARTAVWKYITPGKKSSEAMEAFLFDIAKDPDEKDNLLGMDDAAQSSLASRVAEYTRGLTPVHSKRRHGRGKNRNGASKENVTP